LNGKRKKIIATSSHRGGINAIVPVISRLINEERVDMVLIGHGQSERYFKEKNIDYQTIDSYGLKDISVDSISQLIEEESPDLVLTGTAIQDREGEDVIDQTITSAARNLGIKTLAVLDFWAEYLERFSDIFTNEIFKFLPDKIAVVDNIAKEEMVAKGFPRERLVITGNPYFEGLREEAGSFTEKERKAIRKEIGLGRGLLIYYAETAFEREKEKIGYWDLDNIKLINEVILSLPRKIGLVVGEHPRLPQEDSRKIKQYLSNYPNQKTIKNIDSRKLILASDLVLTSWSSIGVAAVYMKKPCVSLQPGLKGEDPLIVSKLGTIPAGYTIEDCKREVEKAILDRDHRERVIPMRYSSFGRAEKATENVVKLVYEMIR